MFSGVPRIADISRPDRRGCFGPEAELKVFGPCAVYLKRAHSFTHGRAALGRTGDWTSTKIGAVLSLAIVGLGGHAMARLTSVAIRRFKRIEQLEIPLDDVTLLIGANNTGKSSILQAIHFAASIAQTARLVGEGVSWQRDKFELSFDPSQLLYSPVADVLSLATGGTLQEPRTSQIEIEFRAEGGESTVVGLRRGRNRNIAVSIAGRTIGEQ
jgi:hypothetical protein